LKREILFEAVRDEHGDLSLEITDTGIALDMSSEFWNGSIKRFETPSAPDEYFDTADLGRKDEVIRILKEGVANQEEEEKEENEEIP